MDLHELKQEIQRLRRELQREQELRNELMEQINDKAMRKWPHGRSGPDDDGQLIFAVAYDPEHRFVLIQFGKPVAWMALKPEEAIEFASCILRKANTV